MGSLSSAIFWRQKTFMAALLLSISVRTFAADNPAPLQDTSIDTATTNAPGVKTPSSESAEAQQALRAYLHLQEQLHQTLLTIEQNRKESEAASQQNAEMLANRLKLIEQALTRQRENEMETARSSSRFALMVAGSLGGVGLLVMLFTAWFLMRTARQFSELTAFAAQPALGHTAPAGLLADGSFRSGLAEASGGRLLGAIERLEKRMHDIEASAAMSHAGETSTGDHKAENPLPSDPKEAQIALLLGKGQSLLHLDQPENAIVCFDEVLTIDPKNTEAHVKKGTAYEKLKRLEDAISCYDRAIAVDDSMTLAYLYKGGVFNQLERFGEALQCYEKALRTQQRVAAN